MMLPLSCSCSLLVFLASGKTKTPAREPLSGSVC